MKKVLIADSSVGLMENLYNALCHSYDIRLCSKASELNQQISAFRPDILLLDLMLPGVDGISVIKTAADEGIYPAVITTTFFISDYVAVALQELGVKYMIRKPCLLPVLTARVMEAELEPSLCEDKRLSADVTERLLRLGMRVDLQGYRYVLAAILYLYDNPEAGITGQLYPEVAGIYGVTQQQVERSMRTCVQKAWENRNIQEWSVYFGKERAEGKKRITNGEFVKRIAAALNQKRERYMSR